MEVNKTIHGNNEYVPDKLLDMFLLSRVVKESEII